MRPIGNTICKLDYPEITDGVAAADRATAYLRHKGVRIEIPTEHRMWEYGTAIQIALQHYQERMDRIEVLDVGAGWGVLGPALSFHYDTQVFECEPDPACRKDREKCNAVLKAHKRKGIVVSADDILHLPEMRFDVVCCVSVIEHLPPDVEKACWWELARRVKPGGLLYLTMDCVPLHGRSYQFDNLRQQNFTVDDIKPKVELLQSYGFSPLGKPEFCYNGAYVYDYTFYRLGMLNDGVMR